ncbi:MAG TPA: glycoside hydrolase family 15 protein [Candidatus Saccharimonadaceae bacterium]|nr:glycoside hydrolase family 15 protein [Candidatus Saccharimonadaceae bacterium]
MSRPIVLSNGQMHVGINEFGLVHDFYYPYVGLENHSAGRNTRHRIGIFVDGAISWLDEDSDWTFRFHYPHHALIGHILAKNERIGVLLEFDDAVDAKQNAFMRNIHVINQRPEKREIRLFLHQAFVIGDSRSNTDTARYLPDSHAVLHYRGRRLFVISGCTDNEPFDQYTTGLFGIEGHEGTFRDAEDGELSMCAVEHGRVDSTLRFTLQLDGLSSGRVHYWIAAGQSLRAALSIHKELQNDGVLPHLHSTAKFWREWLKPADKVAERIDPEFREEFLHSVMILKSHMDVRGAVMASTDTSMLKYWRDAYAYFWPRDGAYVLWPLIRMGYNNEARAHFNFCRRALHPNGYLMHKYLADGSIGSSWHPYVHENGEVAPPIQEDETALVLFVFAQYYKMQMSAELLDDFYDTMVVPVAEFLRSFTAEHTGLPRASYDLWEERFMTTTYTTAVVYAALQAAAELADDRHDEARAVSWRAAAGDIYQAAHKYLFNEKRQSFYRGIHSWENNIEYDETIDFSSIFGAFMFGLFPVDSEQLQAAVRTAEERFNSSATIGVPRYEYDNYQRSDDKSLGNLWFVSSLWMAQYYGEIGRADDAKKIIQWVQSSAGDGGILGEQIDPSNGESVSVAPLAWSHAEFVSTLLDTIADQSGGSGDGAN